MRLIGIENFRLTDRNKANGDAIFDVNGQKLKADFIFYLQGNDCLSIRVGRHDLKMQTVDLENFIKENRLGLRRQVKPDVERVRAEVRARLLKE